MRRTVLSNRADLARLQVPQPLPAKLAALLVPGAIESDHVRVRVEPEIGRGPLRDRDRPGLCAQGALPSRTLGVERVHRLHEDAREVAEQRAVLSEPPAPPERERQHHCRSPLCGGRTRSIRFAAVALGHTRG